MLPTKNRQLPFAILMPSLCILQRRNPIHRLITINLIKTLDQWNNPNNEFFEWQIHICILRNKDSCSAFYPIIRAFNYICFILTPTISSSTITMQLFLHSLSQMYVTWVLEQLKNFGICYCQEFCNILLICRLQLEEQNRL